MRITSVEAIPVRLPRDLAAATGTAGSPTRLQAGSTRYRWSEAFPALYPVDFETALVRIRTSDGLTGWGEAQAPLAPEVACAIIDNLLAPILVGAEFSGSVAEIRRMWDRMYTSMRVRGQTGGFMLDAISGLDIALWDLAGKSACKPVAELIAGGPARAVLPAYLSGLAGSTLDERLQFALRYHQFGQIKLYLGSSLKELLETMDALGSRARVAVDVLWHLPEEEAVAFGRDLDKRGALWLECPYPPEDPLAHGRLARAIRTPIAIGESYRTHYELEPFFREGAVGVLQPDLGRVGITEALRLAEMAARHGVPVVPHLSIAAGPQIAAAIHFAAACRQCSLLEYNPKVFEMANSFLLEPLRMKAESYITPVRPGLGADVRMDESRRQPAMAPVLD